MPAHNIYQIHQSDQKVFRHFDISDNLIVYYNCPQIDRLVQLYSVHNQFLFSIGGKRTFHQGDQSWTITKDMSFMLKRVAYHQELHDDTEGWEVLAFYIKDNYFKHVMNEFRSHLDLTNLPPHTDDMLLHIYLNDRIRNCYFSMLPYFDQEKPYPSGIIEMKFKELLYNIFIHPKNKHILSMLMQSQKAIVLPFGK